MKFFKVSYFFVNTLRFLPHIFLLLVSVKKYTIENDVVRWVERFPKNSLDISTSKKSSLIYSFVWLLIYKKEFRNIFSNRIKGQFPLSFHLINIFSPRLDSLYIPTTNIGERLFIEHGFSTIISAQKIGDNCSIFQQVTIGYSDNKAPIIRDNVTIYPGAKVIGGITIGDNVIIGANAVVVKNVPANCTVIGVPAYIVRRNGRKTLEKL